MAKKNNDIGDWIDDLLGDDTAEQDTPSRGSKGGVASSNGHPGHQLTPADRARGGRNAQKSGKAHKLTDAERAQGGRS